MITRKVIKAWVVHTLAVLLAFFGASSCDADEAGSPKQSQAGEPGGKMLVAEVLPLKTATAMQFELGANAQLQVVLFEPGRNVISEIKRGTVDARMDIPAWLDELSENDNAFATVDAEQTGPVEDDHYRFRICDARNACRSSVGIMRDVSVEIRDALDTLKNLSAGIPGVKRSARYIRCEKVRQSRWASIQRRGTYRLVEANVLPQPAATAVATATSPAGRFVALDASVDIDSYLTHSQLFVNQLGKIFDCSVFTANSA